MNGAPLGRSSLDRACALFGGWKEQGRLFLWDLVGHWWGSSIALKPCRKARVVSSLGLILLETRSCVFTDVEKSGWFKVHLALANPQILLEQLVLNR